MHFQKTLKNSEEKPSDPGDLLAFILEIVFEASLKVISPSIESDSVSDSLGMSAYITSLFQPKLILSNLFSYNFV